MNHVLAQRGDKGIKTHFITLSPFPQPAGVRGDKGINTYGFIPYPTPGAREAV